MEYFAIGDRVLWDYRKATVVYNDLRICGHYLLKFDDGAGWVGRYNHHVKGNAELHHLLDETGLWWCQPSAITLIIGKDEYEIDE